MGARKTFTMILNNAVLRLINEGKLGGLGEKETGSETSSAIWIQEVMAKLKMVSEC